MKNIPNKYVFRFNLVMMFILEILFGNPLLRKDKIDLNLELHWLENIIDRMRSVSYDLQKSISLKKCGQTKKLVDWRIKLDNVFSAISFCKDGKYLWKHIKLFQISWVIYLLI